MSENTGGKGSKPRPIFDKKAFDQNWDLIFGSKLTPHHNAVLINHNCTAYRESEDTKGQVDPGE